MKFFVLIAIAIIVAQANDKVPEYFTNGNVYFAADVYQKLVKSNSGNIVVCPLSVSTILALVHAGARCTTATQISTALLLPGSTTKIQETFTKLSPILQRKDEYILSSANKMYVNEGFHISDHFKRTAVDVFGSEIQNINFDKKDQAASEINKWVESKTLDKIKNLINSDDLNERTRAVLVNAIYFQGSWEQRFLEDYTSKKSFFINIRRQVDVDMMTQTKYLHYYESQELDANFLELWYTGGEAAMTFVLPNDILEGLPSLEGRMAEVFATEGFTVKYVQAEIPKFKIENTIDFNNILQELGIVDAFQENADFSGIGADKTPLKISKVVQKTFIEVEEKGTTAAAAASSVIAEPLSARPRPIQFVADHPFLYFIKVKGVVIFAGRYSSPEV